MYVVSIPDERDRVYWVEMTRWVETILGVPGENWCTNDVDGAVLYFFRNQRIAEQFDRVWNRTPIIFPYTMWDQFCINDLGRARLNNKWSTKGWTPTSVLIGDWDHRPKVIGGRRVYMKTYKCWFFESYNDALVYWMSRE